MNLLNMISGLSKEILKNQNKILSNIDRESIDVYLFLKKEYLKGNIKNNYLFQFVFRSFYRLDNAGLSEIQKIEYFNLLSKKQVNLKIILEKLYKLKNRRGLNTIQFSFATKLLHTIDNNNPIFDVEVSRVISKRVSGNNKGEKIDSCIEIYQYIKDIYSYMLKEENIKKLILEFRKKFNIDNKIISDVKILDFIIWSFGKIKIN